MTRTSIGFHTIRISIRLSGMEFSAIIEAFKRHCKTVGGMKIYAINDSKTYFKIEFTGKDRGVSWILRFCKFPEGYKSYCLDAIINPKILTGENDYITAANETHIGRTEHEYNSLVSQISDELPLFSFYKLVEVHYCINFKLDEMGYCGLSAENMMKLLKRGNIPDGYCEAVHYDETAHRMKSYENSLYLLAERTVINCYNKEKEMIDRYTNHPERKSDVESSRNVIRFEVQCKPPKINYLRRILSRNTGYALSEREYIRHLLSDSLSERIIHHYFKKVIGLGNYYERQTAVDIIESRCRSPLRKRLIAALEFIGDKRGVHKALACLKNPRLQETSKIFAYELIEALRELPSRGINPVTIPRPWGIDYIPGLLSAFKALTGKFADYYDIILIHQ